MYREIAQRLQAGPFAFSSISPFLSFHPYPLSPAQATPPLSVSHTNHDPVPEPLTPRSTSKTPLCPSATQAIPFETRKKRKNSHRRRALSLGYVHRDERKKTDPGLLVFFLLLFHAIVTRTRGEEEEGRRRRKIFAFPGPLIESLTHFFPLPFPLPLPAVPLAEETLTAREVWADVALLLFLTPSNCLFYS